MLLLSSLSALHKWVSRTDLQKFDILVCVGNKVDLVRVHTEYRRRLQKLGDPFADDGPGFTAYGISETERSCLLGDDEPYWEARHTCLEWCNEHNIEFVEACASNADFDKCLSVDGDSQDLSDEESDYEFEYEVLSAGSADPFGDTEEWVSANGFAGPSDMRGLAAQGNLVLECKQENGTSSNKEVPRALNSTAVLDDSISKGVSSAEEPEQDTEHDQAPEPDEGTNFEFEDLEQSMSEIGNMRNSSRLLPDFQRRDMADMAAMLAMKMATMFGVGSDGEVESIGE
ncbi:hypothetical protein PS2_026541 [Malus domestica]